MSNDHDGGGIPVAANPEYQFDVRLCADVAARGHVTVGRLRFIDATTPSGKRHRHAQAADLLSSKDGRIRAMAEEIAEFEHLDPDYAEILLRRALAEDLAP